MTINNLTKRIENFRAQWLALKHLINIDQNFAKLEDLKSQTLDSFFWQNQEQAIQVNQEIENLNKNLTVWLQVDQDLSEISDLLALTKDDDLVILQELEQKISILENTYQSLEFLSLFSEPYDSYNVVLSIKAGVGGLDAQDWAQILERMYLRFCERQGLVVEILNKSYGQAAGIKSLDLKISGHYAYGWLKSEHGTHRLLRNSPFNADGLRQTSFAIVEVLPEITQGVLQIKEEDLKIDVFRSSGPGGQGVNTTDSAVRVTHLPSKITATCQSERSQHQNKENALKILRSKLYQLTLASQEEELKKLGEGSLRADWGQQVRSYFLYGNKLIKDHRSNFETSNIEAVLDGDLQALIEAYLRFNKQV